MPRSESKNIWLDLMVTIGIALLLLVGFLAGRAITWWMVIALVVVGLLWELRRWFRGGNARWQ